VVASSTKPAPDGIQLPPGLFLSLGVEMGGVGTVTETKTGGFVSNFY
jgi:hypothetical protein